MLEQSPQINAPGEGQKTQFFCDLNHYRTKVSLIAKMDGSKLIESNKDEIAGFTAGKWAISILAGDPGLDVGLIGVHELVTESIALWLKVRDDIDQSLRLSGDKGRLPEYAQHVLKTTLDKGLSVVPQLQDLVDAAIRENDLKRAKEISKFKLNIYIQTLKIRELLNKSGVSLISEAEIQERAARHEERAKQAQDVLLNKGLPAPNAAARVTGASGGRNRKAGKRIETTGAGSRRKEVQKENPATLERSKKARTNGFASGQDRTHFIWLGVMVAALLVPFVIVFYEITFAPSASSQQGIRPEQTAHIINLETVETRGLVFYGKVNMDWYRLKEQQKKKVLQQLRIFADAKGLTAGILTGQYDERVGQWTTKEIALLDAPK